jgi:hypothetical protein
MIIPGQSLTAEPKNAPYENPPQMVKPEDAINWHLDRFTDYERYEALMDALQLDIDVVTITKGLLRNAVMQGRHSVDVSIIIAPVIHEFIKTTAENAGIEFDEGFDEEGRAAKRKEMDYTISTHKARKLIAEFQDEIDAVVDPDPVSRMASKAVKEVDTKEDTKEETKPEAEPEAKSKGLMARGSNQDKEGVV